MAEFRSRGKGLLAGAVAGVAAMCLVAGYAWSQARDAAAPSVAVATPVPHLAPRIPPERILKLGYSVYLGGLNVFVFTTDLTLNGENYSISGSGESRGMVRLFWKWAAHLTSGGTVGPEGLRAQIYNIATMSKHGYKSMQLSFDEKGKYTIRRTPPDTKLRKLKRRLPVVVPAHTVDPLSVALRISRAIEDGRGCKGVYPIFDGDRRYNLTFTDRGLDKLDKTPYSVFSGIAYHCQFDMQRISGFDKPRVYVRYWDEDDFDPPQIWLARIVPHMPPVPVRLRGDLNMGGLLIYLVWAEYGGHEVYANGEKPVVQQIRNK